VIPLSLAKLAAYNTESEEPPSVKITIIFGSPFEKLAH